MKSDTIVIKDTYIYDLMTNEGDTGTLVVHTEGEPSEEWILENWETLKGKTIKRSQKIEVFAKMPTHISKRKLPERYNNSRKTRNRRNGTKYKICYYYIRI